MTDYKIKCEQPTVKCKFVYTQHQEFLLYIELTIPELDQVKKGNYDIMELWTEKNPDADKYDGVYVDADSISRVQIADSNFKEEHDKWITIPVKTEVKS